MTSFLLSIVLVLSLCACAPASSAPSGSSDSIVLTAQILKLYQDSALLCGSDPEDSALYTIPTSLPLSGTDTLTVGATISINYDGTILETAPAQLSNPTAIRVIGKQETLLPLYEDILQTLWEKDVGLNPTEGVLAFDLTAVSNLSKAEKEALLYLASNRYGLETISGTFQSLCDEGYIDKASKTFSNGMFLRLDTAGESKKTFRFVAQKWRSGDGAYMLRDCIATKTADGWQYTIGTEVIS